MRQTQTTHPTQSHKPNNSYSKTQRIKILHKTNKQQEQDQKTGKSKTKPIKLNQIFPTFLQFFLSSQTLKRERKKLNHIHKKKKKPP